MCLGASVQSYPHVKWGAKYNESQRKFWVLRWLRRENKYFYLITIGFMDMRSSLSRQLDTNFPSKGWVSCTSAQDNCSKSSFGLGVSIFWLSLQTWAPAILRPQGRERFLEYKEMRYSILLWTALWTEMWMMTRGITFQHLKSLHFTWIQLAVKGWFRVIRSWLLFSWIWPSFLLVMITCYSPKYLMRSGNMVISLQWSLTGK